MPTWWKTRGITKIIMKKGWMLCCVALVLPLLLHAQQKVTVFVAPGGNDAYPGTSAKPLATLTAARNRSRELRKRQKLTVPLEISIAPGTYQLPAPLVLTAEDAGTAESPLVFKGQGNIAPVFSGGAELPAFEKVSDKLWKVPVPAACGDVQQVFVNGNRAVRARTPNAGSMFKTGKVTEILTDTGQLKKATAHIRLSAEQWKALQAVPDAELGRVVVSVHHAWDRTRKYIRERLPEDSAISFSGRPMKSWNRLDNSSQFMLENARAFLDAPGEWWIDPQRVLWYIPREGETTGNSRATIPLAGQFIVIAGDSSHKVTNIRFENLSFQYTRYTMPPEGNEPAQAAAPTPAVIMADHAAFIRFDHCEIAHTGANGIWFRTGCTDSKITHCYLHDLGIGGIKIGDTRLPQNEQAATRNITADNNILRAGSREFPTGVGVIIFHAGNNTVSHNEIADFYYTGISVGWIWGYSYSPAKRNRIIYNHIHDIGQGLLSDMGGVYTLGPSEGTVVANNVIHDIYSYGYGGWGLYTDEGSTGIVMENNLVYRCKSAGFHQHYGENNIIRNNIFVSQLKAQLEATRVERHCSFYFTNNIIYFGDGSLTDSPAWEKAHFLADSNCYWNPHNQDILFGKRHFTDWQLLTGKDRNSIIANPGFANIAGDDFHISDPSVMARIGFKPFAYEQAGVYGGTAWRQLAAEPFIRKNYRYE